MIIPVRCFTCGKVLADKYDYYVRKVKELEAEPAQTAGGAGASAGAGAQDRHFEGVRTGPILDALGLTRYCCRRSILGTVDLMEAI